MKQNTASQRIVADIRAKIRAGALSPGDLVPSARQIVREQGVALATATKVLALLRREGLVRSKAGVGTVVLGERAPDLSRERIVAAAIAIADDDGTDALSMRTLARELGVATMSLYRHVRSREELLGYMVDAVFAERPPPRPAGPTREGWRAKLEAIARLQWDGYRRHPWLAHAVSMTRPQATRNGMRHTEAVLAVLAPLKLGDAETLRLGIAFIAYVRGMAASLESELRAEQDTGMTREEWMDANEASFAAHMAEMPQLARLGQVPDVDVGLDALFECGLRCWLDGLASQVRR
ncbi:MAG TPA: TetR/AcrR family transcriptional regulator C-terminal domain-containing protein [Polyangiaceae bacterium]